MKYCREYSTALAILFFVNVITGFAAPYTLQVRDTIGRSWEQEPIEWQLNLKEGEFKGGSLLVQRDGKAIPAQADVEENYPDGSAKIAGVRFLIDKLDKDAATQFTAEFGKEGPSTSSLKVSEEREALVLDNGLTAVRVLNRNTDSAPSGEFSPMLAIRLPSSK